MRMRSADPKLRESEILQPSNNFRRERIRDQQHVEGSDSDPEASHLQYQRSSAQGMGRRRDFGSRRSIAGLYDRIRRLQLDLGSAGEQGSLGLFAALQPRRLWRRSPAPVK